MNLPLHFNLLLWTGVKRRQERKDKITKYCPYSQNDRQFISISFHVIITRKSRALKINLD